MTFSPASSLRCASLVVGDAVEIFRITEREIFEPPVRRSYKCTGEHRKAANVTSAAGLRGTSPSNRRAFRLSAEN